MNRPIKFRVYYEAVVNGEIIKGIEEPCSWFLLTQTGQIMEYGPITPPSRPDKGYTKLIPLFFTGLFDRNGKEIYEEDIVNFQTSCDGEWHCGRVQWRKDSASFLIYGNIGNWENVDFGIRIIMKTIEVIGNHFENPELLEGGSDDPAK